MAHEVDTANDAYRLLRDLAAPERLLRHAEAVRDVAAQLSALQCLGVDHDNHLVQLGAILHDAGKIVHPAELTDAGSAHEAAGEDLLLAHGLPPRLARCCRSHAAWQTMECSLEELMIALADKLWKGARRSDLELVVVDRVAERLGKDRWDVFLELDGRFEEIAANGAARLARSQ